MYTILIYILILILFLFIQKKNQCNQDLTDDEYLTHMIDHHQVAVDMSEIHLQTTKNPIILDMIRKLILVQTYEIKLMKHSKNNKEDDMSDSKIKMDTSYTYTQGDFSKPNMPYISKTFCDPSFFKMSHNLHTTMTDTMYMKHMIPHHQVAIDMSKKILKTTKNDFVIDLAYNIIHSQQLEIFNLYYLLKSKYKFESNIL